MKTVFRSSILAISLFLTNLQAEETWHTFTGSNGVEIRGQLIEVKRGHISLRVLRPDGSNQVYQLHINRFSPDSQLTIGELWEAQQSGESAAKMAPETAKPNSVVGPVENPNGNDWLEAKGPVENTGRKIHTYSPEKLNASFGHALFDENGFRDDDPDTLFARLSLEKTNNGAHSSLGSRFGSQKEVFGQQARSIEIHGREGEGTHRLSFLFSNMQTAERGLNAGDVRADLASLSAQLTQAIGEPEEFRRFSPPDTKLVLWRTTKVAFLLSHSRNEFTFLDIFNTTDSGRVEYLRAHSTPFRQAVGESVDIWLHTEIHRQGRMNCYPTTASAVMNQAGIPVNPYLVGAAVYTDDGGTFDKNLTSGIEEILSEMDNRGAEEPFSEEGYRLASQNGSLTFEQIVSHIFQGRSIFVSTYAMEGLEPYLESYAQLRTSASPDKELERNVRSHRTRMQRGPGHAGAIIGYNKERNDVLYADPTLSPGWMEFDLFVDFMQGLHFVIEKDA